MVVLTVAVTLLAASGCGDDDGGNPDPIRRDDATQVSISEFGSLQNPAFSPDGATLLCTRFRNGYNEEPADLLLVTLDSGATHTLVSDGSGNINLPGSAWNAATGQIVFSSSRDPHDEIFLIAENGGPGDEVPLTDRPDHMGYESSLSPDGAWVVFESHVLDVEGDGVITRYRVDGTSGYEALTDVGEDCRQPNWSPAGDLILYQRYVGGQWELFVMGPDGSAKRQVTDGVGDKTDASFSPDGQWLVYSGEIPARDTANLFIVPVSGGPPEQITDSDGYDGAPSWSPDGGRIAFEAAAGDPDGSVGTTLWIIDISSRMAGL